MNNKITFKNVEDGLSYFLFEGNLLCVLTFRKSSRPFCTPHVGATVTLPCFQEIQTLQGKKTDVGELEKEREEAVQRLQVGSCCPPPGSSAHLPYKVYHGNHQEERTKHSRLGVTGSVEYVTLLCVSTVTEVFNGPRWSSKPLFPIRLRCCAYILCGQKLQKHNFTDCRQTTAPSPDS